MNSQEIEKEYQEIEKDPVRLSELLHSYTLQRQSAIDRKIQFETLMQRPSAKNWKAEKTAKMVRRYVTVVSEIEQANNAIDVLSQRLNQLEHFNTK